MDDYPLPNLNAITLAGKIPQAPGLVYRKDGVPVLKFVVRIEDRNDKLEQIFTTVVPCEFIGERAEQIGAELQAGETVLVSGRLAYRGTAGQNGGTLGVWCHTVQRLRPVAVGA
jgi:single-stranded DNA-binding protein